MGETTLQEYLSNSSELLYNNLIKNDLAPKELCYPGNVPALHVPSVTQMATESTQPNTMDDVLNGVVTAPLINGDGLMFALNTISTNDGRYSKPTIQAVAERIADTYKYEYTHENYQDCPIVEFVDNGIQVLSEAYNIVENPIAKANLSDLETQIAEAVMIAHHDVTEETSPNFCPNPYDVYNLCPFPVGERNVSRAIFDIYNAKDDDALTEAFIKLNRLSIACNENYTATMESNVVTKKARAISRKANEVESKAIRKVGGTTKELDQAGKHAVDPMMKLMQQTLTKIKDADDNERKKIMLAGHGSIEKVLLKSWRWTKRGIGVMIGAAVGAHIPAVALVTGITFVAQIATDKYFDKKVRNNILRELEDEIEIVNEKIDDSRNDEDKKSRYELIRIRNQLQHTRDKVQYGLKY